MDRPVHEAERAAASRCRAADLLERRGGKARGRHVDRLLEKGTVQRIGLVEDRQDLEGAVGQETFHRDLRPGNVLLDEDPRCRVPAPSRNVRVREDRSDSPPGRAEGLRIVPPDHAAASREKRRLQNARVGAGGRGHPPGRRRSERRGTRATAPPLRRALREEVPCRAPRRPRAASFPRGRERPRSRRRRAPSPRRRRRPRRSGTGARIRRPAARTPRGRGSRG